MKQSLPVTVFLFILLALFGSWFAGTWIKGNEGSGKVVSRSLSSCDLLKSACEFRQLDNNFKIQFTGRPSPLVPFFVTLKANAQQPDAVKISFEMEGMDMGYAVYQMRYQPLADIWKAKVILPICATGRADWRLNVHLKSAGEWYMSEFEFLLK
ncbi:MAG TPA: hypothetical protein ENJ08_20120 [Gammaproteobacteria bacterium]|nr:hypothetical protein [Gammaproteobacteria bacterium]